ncbi:hypothetical protein COCOBI_08-0850 [Coccomyxa sp. Obi]|nr:hypothetical protein COCOBI_08-0850 [Coccomyxa sp. Obi]
MAPAVRATAVLLVAYLCIGLSADAANTPALSEPLATSASGSTLDEVFSDALLPVGWSQILQTFFKVSLPAGEALVKVQFFNRTWDETRSLAELLKAMTWSGNIEEAPPLCT